uniref:Chitin-binding type-2 domain-containing protein n=1 Tax=Aceria tosichella TaxID=561515 RepID=A0A6G1SDT3_9ACAR
MSTSRPKPTATTITICAISLMLLSLIAIARCQAPDGDDSFEFQHQDIGRISGLSSGTSQVAPQTTIVARQQPSSFASSPQAETVQPQLPTTVAAAVDQVAQLERTSQSRHTQRQQTTGSQRKPNRVTLVARRDPPSVVTSAQPASLAVQLPAPPQQYSTPQQYQTAAPSAASLELPQPTFAPQPPQQEAAPQQLAPSSQQPLTLVSGPALNSFRATGGSVSPRHSALIAQVAAERAAAASLISTHSEPAPQSPALAPVSHEQQHQHHHQQQQQQQPAFASFSSQLASQQAASSSQLLTTPFQGSHHHQGQARQHQQQQQQQLSSASQPQAAVNQLEEPVVAPSFEHVLGHGCPHKGVFSWENKEHCDRYYMCTNGTFTEEACPNGLAYSQLGAVYQHCAYNWNVNCGNKKTAEPIASPGCPWQFGIFPIVQNGRCSIDYYACEWGVPETKRCTPEGLFYDDRIKGCQWADQLGCKSEGLLNFKCPSEDEDNPYWPYPRYYHTAQDVIVCVNEQPRLVHCNEDQLVDSGSLACIEVRKKKRPL